VLARAQDTSGGEARRTTFPQIALVTGGSRGIGAATARALAAAGWDVAISYRTRQEEAEQVVRDCRALGRRAMAVQADVSVETDLHRLFAAVADGLGPLTTLVNNAGVVTPPGTVDTYTAERISRLFAINVTGAFLAAGLAVSAMSVERGGRGGTIVNVSSRAAQLGGAGEYVDYAASKAAVDILTVGLAAEVAKEGIRVVGVRPGLIDTDIHLPGRLERLGHTPPLGRPGTAEEVAAAIVFLASDQASYVTGSTLDVGGGR
jgi:NAD(P)-dependent dehydrogenase (short-subunit alcohol dehydrogenase family)